MCLDMVRTRRRLRESTLLLVISAVACTAPREASRARVEPRIRAERFVAALNAGDIPAMLSSSSDSIVVREQRWTSAPDGSGFTLGAVRDTVLIGVEAKRSFLAQRIPTVRVRGTTAVERPPTREALLARELKESHPQWSRVQLFVFLRGEGDVEHIVIIGVDPAGNDVAAFYVN
jgi:hypothetical protein